MVPVLQNLQNMKNQNRKLLKSLITYTVAVTICVSTMPTVGLAKPQPVSRTLIPSCAQIIQTGKILSEQGEVPADPEDLARWQQAAQAESTKNAVQAMKQFIADWNMFQGDRLGITETGRIQPKSASIDEVEVEHTGEKALKRSTLRAILNRFYSIEHFQRYKPDRGDAKVMGAHIKGAEDVLDALELMVGANEQMHEHWKQVVDEAFVKTKKKRNLWNLVHPASYTAVAGYLLIKFIMDLPNIFSAATSGDPAAALMGAAVFAFGGIIALGFGTSLAVLKLRWEHNTLNAQEQSTPQNAKKGLFHTLTKAISESPFSRLGRAFQKITANPEVAGFYYLGDNYELPKGIYRRLVMMSSGTEPEKLDWPGVVQIEAAQHKAPDKPGNTASRIPVTAEDKAGKEKGHVYFDALLRYEPDTDHKLELVLFVRHTDDSIKNHQLEGSSQSQRFFQSGEALAQ